MDNRRELKRAPRFWPGRWTRAALLLTGGMTVVSAAPLPRPTEAAQVPITLASSGELAVLTYNVKGLSWPVASGRDEALARIGARLAAMRRQGRQAGVVVLQEAFTAQAKAIGTAAGYAWQVQGPYARSGPGNPVGGSWYLGENQSAMLDSGLAVLSDYAVLAVERMAFPEGDCAGFDCLVAKGVLLVTLDVPGAGPVTVAATHLNSRKASGAPFARANAAYSRQTEFLGNVLRARTQASGPLIVVGDFNRGDRPTRLHRQRPSAPTARVVRERGMRNRGLV